MVHHGIHGAAHALQGPSVEPDPVEMQGQIVERERSARSSGSDFLPVATKWRTRTLLATLILVVLVDDTNHGDQMPDDDEHRVVDVEVHRVLQCNVVVNAAFVRLRRACVAASLVASASRACGFLFTLFCFLSKT